jgi:hypothetical protein
MLNQVHDLRYQFGILIVDDPDGVVRKLILQIAHQHLWVLAHHNRANQVLRYGNDDEAQGTRRDSKTNGRRNIYIGCQCRHVFTLSTAPKRAHF